MKQQITKQQLQKLSDYQIEKLYEYWWNKNNQPRNKYTQTARIEYGIGTKYELPLMTIGDMIEFLKTNNCSFDIKYHPLTNFIIHFGFTNYTNKELSDDLWKTVKEILNK